jgi:pyruvate formate lyase activating enzyme
VLSVTDKGLIFDIQGYSVHDGPGTRTLVFLSGCPLYCEWCANPEGMEKRQNLMFAESRCKAVQDHCRRCEQACTRGAIHFNPDTGLPQIERDICRGCTTFDCVDVCNYEALRKAGKYYTVAELMNVLQRDRNFWGSDGGVTFSGGEPMMQSDFLLQVLIECKNRGIHTAIETSGYVDQNIFLALMKYIDFAFVDIKHRDSATHKDMTGVENKLILENVRALAASDWPGRLILRTPIIPGFNDSKDNAEATIVFMKECGLMEINLLPFHRMGTSKWRQLGKAYLYEDVEGVKKDDLVPLQRLYYDAGIVCYLDTDIVYDLS